MNQFNILSRSDNFLFNEIDGEVVMMNIETGIYASLNKTAKSIWDLLESPITFGEITESISKKYNIPIEKCLEDIIPFLFHMEEHQIIKIEE